jgi:hypothetical protein
LHLRGAKHLYLFIYIAKMKTCESPDNGQINAELIQAGCEILWSEIHELTNSI